MKHTGISSKHILVGAIALCSVISCIAQAQRRPLGARPATTEQYIAVMNAALDRVDAKLETLPKHPILLSANLFLAHGSFIKYFALRHLILYADCLKEAGVRRIDINPAMEPWLDPNGAEAQDVIGKYDGLIRHIRELGLQIALNPEYTRTDPKFVSFDEWQSAVLRAYPVLARRYKPDIFVVLHEPTTMCDRLRVPPVGPPRVREFIATVSRAVKEASPSSRIGAGVLPREISYFQAFVSLPEIQVTSLDIYNLQGLETANQIVREARAAAKPIYIEETWRTPFAGSRDRPMNMDQGASVGIGNSRFMALDARWLRTMARYASAWGMEAVTAFWTQTLIKYNDEHDFGLSYEYNKDVTQGLERHERTATFKAFRRLVEEFQQR